MSSELARLCARCAASVEVSVNDHRDVYQTVRQAIDEARDRDYGLKVGEIDPATEAKMVETDTFVRLHFYPRSPVAFVLIWHHDVDAAVAEAHAYLDAEGIA